MGFFDGMFDSEEEKALKKKAEEEEKALNKQADVADGAESRGTGFFDSIFGSEEEKALQKKKEEEEKALKKQADFVFAVADITEKFSQAFCTREWCDARGCISLASDHARVCTAADVLPALVPQLVPHVDV